MGLPIVFRFNLADEDRFGPELLALLGKSHPHVSIDPINKAFLRNVPKTADGKIDYAAIPTGSTIWITVTDAASPMHGRHIPITKRGDGSMSLDPHAAEAAGYHFGSYMNELKGRAHSTLSTGQEKQAAKDEEKEKAAKEARKEREPLERKMKELRIEQRQREKEAFDKFIESTGIQKTGLSKDDKTKIFETAQQAAIQNGLDEQQSKVFARTITSQIDLEDRKRKEEAAIHHQKRIRALADIWGDKKRDDESESGSPEYATHPHELISAGSTPEEPLKVSSINVAELAKQVALEIEETGQDKLHHVEVMAQDALRNAIQEDYVKSGSGVFDTDHDMPGPAAPEVVNEIESEMEEPPVEADPNVIKIGEGLDTLKPVTEIKDPEAFKKTMEAYNELAEIKAQSLALAHEMPKLERLQITAPASLEAFRMDAVVADENDIQKAYQHLEDSRFEGGYGSFYEALSEHWNETEGYANISSHVIDGSTSALTAILGKNLGRNYDIRRVVEALGPQGASVVIAVELRRKLGQEGFDRFREKLMFEHAANVDKTEKEAIKKHIELKKQLDKVINQKNNGELLNEASIQTMQTDILLRQRQNLGQAFGSLNATGDLIQSMEKLSSLRTKSQVLGKDAIEVKINCGNDIVTAQDRLVELGLGELKPDGSFKIKGKDGMVKVLDPKASGTGKYQIVTDGLYLADRFTKSKVINGTTSEDLHRIKTDDSPVTVDHNPPGFRSSFFDPISETQKDFTLRKSQRNDINFLLKAGGGVITRTTGAGKTNTILGVAAHRIHENQNYRQLVAVPNGQVRQWVNEAGQFMDYNVVSHPEIGKLKGEERMNAIRELASKIGKRSVVEIPEGLTAQERQHLYSANKGGSIYVSSHKDISTDVDTIEGQGFHGLAIDEPHMLTAKGGGKISAPGKRIMAIPAQHKIATTATLTRDKLVEAHDIVNWAARKPQLGPDGLPRVNRHNGAILYDKPIGSRVAFQGSVGGFGSGTNSQDEAISELITNRFKDFISGDALKHRDYKVNTQKIENITRSKEQIARQKEIESSVDQVKKEILADEIAKNNERGADSRYSQQKLIRAVNERTRREVQRRHENNLYGGFDNNKTKAFSDNLKRSIAEGKTHHVVLVGSGEQRRSVADAVKEIGIKGTRRGVFTVTSDTSKKDIERIKEAWKSSKDPAVIILDSSTSAGHNLQEAHAMHVLGNPRDAATWKQFEGRGDRPGRLGDLDINLYRYEDSPHEDVHWNRLFDQAKIGRATAPGLFKSMMRTVKAYLTKAHVRAHTRVVRGQIVPVKEHDTGRKTHQEGLRYDPNTNKHSGVELVRGDELVTDNGVHYRLERNHGFYLEADEMTPDGEYNGKTISFSVEPWNKAEFLNVHRTGKNYWERSLKKGFKLEGKTYYQGIPISIENAPGSTRSGTDPDGHEWRTTMQITYGRIPWTRGADGDAVDVFVNESHPLAENAYVVHILNPITGKYDEDKVFLGFDSKREVWEAFKNHYDNARKVWGSCEKMCVSFLKTKLGIGEKKPSISKANPAWQSELRDERGRWIKIGDGDFGPIFTDIHDGDAVRLLMGMQTGEVRGAFYHPILGAIDLVWGVASGKGKSAKGFGLAKIVEKHPEVVETLPTIVRKGKIISETSDKVVLTSGQYKSVVQLHWNSKNKKWLLTSYETEKSPSMRKTADTSHTLVKGRRSDTALPPKDDLLKSIVSKDLNVKNITLPIVFKFKRSA